jgi:patatin-like phospholipase/acyl hydrolase
MNCKYKVILSIDGGGIRGIVPLVILRHIESAFSKQTNIGQLPQLIDVFSGTSTGAIISGALMLRDENGNCVHDVKSIFDLYTSRGKQIFNKDISVRNRSYPLKMVLENNFSKYSINDIKKHFLFVSYDIENHNSFLFTDKMEDYRNMSLSDVMMACSAIPAYFPAVKLGDMELVDGILAAKNPSRFALEYTQTHYPKDPILLISIGTGNLSSENKDAHELEMELVDKQLEDMSCQTSQLIYFRFQPDLKKANDSMDDTSPENIRNLVQDGEEYIREYTAKFDRLFSLMSIKNKSIV